MSEPVLRDVVVEHLKEKRNKQQQEKRDLDQEVPHNDVAMDTTSSTHNINTTPTNFFCFLLFLIFPLFCC